MKEETRTADRDGRAQRSILVEYMYLDLSSLDSVRRFYATLRDRDQSLDILINNAGISWARHCMCPAYDACVVSCIYLVHAALTEDGFEQHYQVGFVTKITYSMKECPHLPP